MLIKCEECRREISDKAATCPHCGAPVTQKVSTSTPPKNSRPSEEKSILGGMIYVIILLVVSIIVIVWYALSSVQNENTRDLDKELAEELTELKDNTTESQIIHSKGWDLTEEVDPMTDVKSVWKSLKSDNCNHFDFPYQGDTYATITVRYMKKYGTDVIFQIDRGQINGSKYRGNDYLTVRFDDGPAEKYYFNNADDGDSEMVFLKATTKFINKAKKAHRILVETSIYQEGNPTWIFTCDDPLTWN